VLVCSFSLVSGTCLPPVDVSIVSLAFPILFFHAICISLRQ
jgi:hypothetical protein